jgi:HAD superfamily hydrolase (TIGR01509 family)
MDGVLADTEPLQGMAWVVLLERYGVHEPPAFFDRWIGIPNIDTSRDVVERWRLPRTPEALIAEREPVYLALVGGGLEPFAGVPERLRALGEVPMAVATSACRTEAVRVLEALGLRDRFRAVVTADDVARAKPDPEPYLAAAAALGVDAGECVAIEDSPSGVSSARAAGCLVLAVTTTHRAERLEGAHQVHASTVSALDAAAALLRARR